MNPLDEALAVLTEQQRAVFLARSEGISFREIGEMLGIGRTTAQGYQREAERKILQVFRPVILRAIRDGDIGPDDLQFARQPSSKYLGVSWQRDRSKWKAQKRVGKKVVCLGYFDNEVDAASAVEASNAA